MCSQSGICGELNVVRSDVRSKCCRLAAGKWHRVEVLNLFLFCLDCSGRRSWFSGSVFKCLGGFLGEGGYAFVVLDLSCVV